MHRDGLMEKDWTKTSPRPPGSPWWVLGFIVFWAGWPRPAHLPGNGVDACSCWKHGHYGRWYGPRATTGITPCARMARQGRRSGAAGSAASAGASADSYGGNVAFDEYREETACAS